MATRPGPFNRRGASYVNWTTDAWGFDRGTDPIYKSIPFYIATGGAGGAYGLFLDNTWRSAFDFGHRTRMHARISADGGPIDYYIIAGPTVADVVRRYTDLTGKAPMPPRWASRVPAIALQLHERDRGARDREPPSRRPHPKRRDLARHRLPGPQPAVHDQPKTFPDLKGLARDVGSQGFKLVAITDLHVANAPNQGYAPYESGVSGNHFLKNPDGSTYVAPVWPGPSVFPDFTRKAQPRLVGWPVQSLRR